MAYAVWMLSADKRIPIEDAATVILLREGAGGRGVETFLLKRHSESGFMGSFHVFPGGRVDPGDRDLSLPFIGRKVEPLPALLSEPQTPQDAVFGLFVAGIRETLEEAGVFLGEARTPEAIDQAIREGRGFRQALEESDARLRLDRLIPYARWVTPPVEKRRFDTRFFFARCDRDESQRACHDGFETIDGAWYAPEEALDRADRLEMMLAPPTLRTLQELAEASDVDEAISLGARRPLPLIRPGVAQVGESFFLTLPGDPLHPEKTRALPGPTRLRWDKGRWIGEEP